MSELESLREPSLRLLAEGFANAQARFFSGSPMRSMLEFHFSSGGKRLRPLLVGATAHAYARRQGTGVDGLLERCAPYALAVELIHNATLIHDDLQDGDRTRRGEPTLWAKYSAAQAINCGDAWFFVPQLLIQEAGYSPELTLRLLDLIQRQTLAVIDGQSQEFALKERFAGGAEISVPDYLRMVEGKTSALFSMPMLGGAAIAGVGGSEREALGRTALHLGQAFQIQDDLLDLWGEKGRGQVGSDIAEGKLSYPLVLALQRLVKGSPDRDRLESIVRSERATTEAGDVQWAIELMESEGVRAEAKQHFAQHLASARQSGACPEVVEYISAWLERLAAGL